MVPKSSRWSRSAPSLHRPPIVLLLGIVLSPPAASQDDLSAGFEVLSERVGASSRHLRLRQLSRGLPVLGSSLTAHFGKDGRLLRTARRTFEESGNLPRPSIGPEAALGLARAAAGNPRSLLESPDPRLAFIHGKGGARLVYECWIFPAEPPGAFRILIDASTGEKIEIEDRRRSFDGTGRVFDPNPVVALQDPTLRDQDDAAGAVPVGAYTTVVLCDLAGSGTVLDPYVLTGPYVSTEGTPSRAREIAGSFLYDRSDPRFEEVMVYHHIDTIQRKIQALGFSDACNRRIQVFVNSRPPGVPFPADKSYYGPDGNGTGFLAFGTGGVDSAEDGEIIAHEYGHAVLDYQVPNFGDTLESVILAEGFCDFFAAACLSGSSRGYGDPCIGEWKATPLGDSPPCLRRLDTRKRYPYDLTYSDRWEDSEIWSGALWDLALEIGVDAALSIALEGNFFLETDATFAEAGESLLLADRELSGGSHRPAIERVLRSRGILRDPIPLGGFILLDPDPDLPIPDDDPFGLASGIDFPRDESILSDLSLQVYIDLVHSYPTDLTVTLISPAGTRVQLTPPYRFPTVYEALDAPDHGSFSALLGEGARGIWRLEIMDGVARETGTLRAWGIKILNIIRGDASADGKADLADVVGILGHLFLGGALDCETRADANDDGSADISDALQLLFYLFAGGPAPPPPFETPGADPTLDGLPCE